MFSRIVSTWRLLEIARDVGHEARKAKVVTSDHKTELSESPWPSRMCTVNKKSGTGLFIIISRTDQKTDQNVSLETKRDYKLNTGKQSWGKLWDWSIKKLKKNSFNESFKWFHPLIWLVLQPLLKLKLRLFNWVITSYTKHATNNLICYSNVSIVF